MKPRRPAHASHIDPARIALAIAIAAVALLAAPPSATAADAAREALESRRARALAATEGIAETRQRWQQEYRGLLADYAAARDRATEAREDWGGKRKRQRLRGEPRAEAREAIETSQQQLADAMTAIRDFRERARREGVEPAWLFSVEDEFPDIASAIAAN